MRITANEFDSSYPGNARWDEALDGIDNGFYDLNCDYSLEDKKSVIYEITGDESEITDFFSIYDLTPTDNFAYRLWKAKGKSRAISKLKKEAIDELNNKLEIQKSEINQFLSEVKPIWDVDMALKSNSIFTRFYDEFVELTPENEKEL